MTEALDDIDVVLAGDVCYDDVLASQVYRKY
jgi:predicted nicotinamide N-methyase